MSREKTVMIQELIAQVSYLPSADCIFVGDRVLEGKSSQKSLGTIHINWLWS